MKGDRDGSMDGYLLPWMRWMRLDCMGKECEGEVSCPKRTEQERVDLLIKKKNNWDLG